MTGKDTQGFPPREIPEPRIGVVWFKDGTREFGPPDIPPSTPYVPASLLEVREAEVKRLKEEVERLRGALIDLRERIGNRAVKKTYEGKDAWGRDKYRFDGAGEQVDLLRIDEALAAQKGKE